MENTRASHYSFDFTLRATCLRVPGGRGATSTGEEDKVRIGEGRVTWLRRQWVTMRAEKEGVGEGPRPQGPGRGQGHISVHPAGVAAGGLSREETEVKQRAGPPGRLAVAS